MANAADAYFNSMGAPSAGGSMGGAMNSWEPGGITGGAGAGGYGGFGGDINQAGAAADPFAYTNGSLLTPWTGRFSSSGYGGGYSAPEYNKFSYGDFSYRPPDVGRFNEQYQDPAAFRFADFAGPSQFKAPTAEDMQADPGYQARLNTGLNAAKAAAAHSGAMRTGGFAKGLSDYASNAASQEYGNVYNRKAGEWDRENARAKDTYGINQGNTKTAFDTNTANRLTGYNTRQNAWRSNADVGLQEGQLGYNIAQGTYDRNYQKARQGWEDDAQHANAVASAASANANQDYQRDLADYTRARDEFWTNQDRQNAIRVDERNFGYNATSDYANRLMGGYGAMGDYAVGAGDAAAAGKMGSANAWGNFASDIGNAAGGFALYGSQQPRQTYNQPVSKSSWGPGSPQSVSNYNPSRGITQSLNPYGNAMSGVPSNGLPHG